jgi:chromate transporter
MPNPAPITAEPQIVPTVSLGEAFRFWLKLGFISFGGPAGQIAIMHEELVERRRWISERRYLHALNYCMVLPGPEAQQLATYIGWLMHRTWGGLIAGGLFVLPSLVILIALATVYMAFGELPAIAGLFYGIKPAVTALVLHAVHRIGGRTLKNSVLWCIAAASDKFRAGGHAISEKNYGAALIDDDTPTPEHARFNKRRLLGIAFIGLALWLLPMAFLFAQFGWSGTLTQMGWFFSKAALLTFGGAYAVLPYVYQGAVDHYAWLTATQMIDGLALGETTPGPLIMVVTFVGFVGGWTHALFGAENLFAAGAVAACVVTYFTFLPSCFFFIYGGPLVESTHGELRFTAPLTAITAAVVGVILNLAIFFGYHVLWPQGLSGAFDVIAAIITIAATIALFYFKRGVIEVIAACALIGLVLTLAGLR